MRKNGFTFIELILVVLIIAALVGISLPRFRKAFNNLQLNNFASELQDQLTFWQERAIIEKKPIVLKIDSEDPKNKKYYTQFMGTETRIKSYGIPSGITVGFEPAEIIFYPDAGINQAGAGQASIILSNSDEEKIILSTQGVFGGFKAVSEEK